MQQYLYEDEYRGQPRRLMILKSAEGHDYRVFHDSQFLGSIKPVKDEKGNAAWNTEYNILKPIAGKIGRYIEEVNYP